MFQNYEKREGKINYGASCARVARLGLVLAVLVGLCAGELAAGGWWNAKWPSRVRVKLDSRAATRVRRAKLPGDDIAVVEFRTAGLADESGRDIRVVSASGKVLPSRILQTGPGDLLSLAFATGGGSKYYIEHHPGAEDPRPGKQRQAHRQGLSRPDFPGTQPVWPAEQNRPTVHRLLPGSQSWGISLRYVQQQRFVSAHQR